MESSTVNLITATTNRALTTNNQNNPVEKKIISKKQEIIKYTEFTSFVARLNPHIKRFVEILNAKNVENIIVELTRNLKNKKPDQNNISILG